MRRVPIHFHGAQSAALSPYVLPALHRELGAEQDPRQECRRLPDLPRAIRATRSARHPEQRGQDTHELHAQEPHRTPGKQHERRPVRQPRGR